MSCSILSKNISRESLYPLFQLQDTIQQSIHTTAPYKIITMYTYTDFTMFVSSCTNNDNNASILLMIFLPSAILKMVASPYMQQIWPILPKWFWFPCGLWEGIGGLLVALSSTNNHPSSNHVVSFVLPSIFNKNLGFPLLYSYMGGVFLSILYIPTNNGQTIVSGKSSTFGRLGIVIFLFATYTTWLIAMMDFNNTTTNTCRDHHHDRPMTFFSSIIVTRIIIYATLGALWGFFLSHISASTVKILVPRTTKRTTKRL